MRQRCDCSWRESVPRLSSPPARGSWRVPVAFSPTIRRGHDRRRGRAQCRVRDRGHLWRSSSSRCSRGNRRSAHHSSARTRPFPAPQSGRRDDGRTTTPVRHRPRRFRSGPSRPRRSRALRRTASPDCSGPRRSRRTWRSSRRSGFASRAREHSHLARPRPAHPPCRHRPIRPSRRRRWSPMSSCHDLSDLPELPQRRSKLAGSVDDCYGTEVICPATVRE